MVDGREARHLVCSDACRQVMYRRDYFARKGARRFLCAVCGKPCEGRRSDATTCSAACRQKAYRQRVTAAKQNGSADSQP
jgi:hypothetical protein